MHNKTTILTAADKSRASKARTMLNAAAPGERVLVNYVRRDGVTKHYEGPVVSRIGTGDKEAVVLDTLDGPRSLNLWRAKSVVLMGQ